MHSLNWKRFQKIDKFQPFIFYFFILFLNCVPYTTVTCVLVECDKHRDISHSFYHFLQEFPWSYFTWTLKVTFKNVRIDQKHHTDRVTTTVLFHFLYIEAKQHLDEFHEVTANTSLSCKINILITATPHAYFCQKNNFVLILNPPWKYKWDAHGRKYIEGGNLFKFCIFFTLLTLRIGILTLN